MQGFTVFYLFCFGNRAVFFSRALIEIDTVLIRINSYIIIRIIINIIASRDIKF